MDALSTIVLMWLASRASGAQASASKAPAWPTPSSPPPMPAFKPKATPTPADAAHPATPLATLHAKPPTPPPADSKPKAAPKRAAVPKIVPGVLTSTLPVARLQKALIARGAKLVPDGLYGPKTAAAWSTLAKAKGLTPTILRKGPKLADVATHTFDALSVPLIP